jgi:hypothetical protein
MFGSGSPNRPIRLGWGLAFLAILGPGTVWAATLNVPARYPTIQAAVDAAAALTMAHLRPGILHGVLGRPRRICAVCDRGLRVAPEYIVGPFMDPLGQAIAAQSTCP